jgi:hypothetical protein
LLKGALVSLTEGFLGPVPNVIVFQYNPEKMTRTLSPATMTISSGAAEKAGVDPTAQPWEPSETFDLTLELDATDQLEFPEEHPVAMLTGVADRIAALEMLLYPSKDQATDLVSKAAEAANKAAEAAKQAAVAAGKSGSSVTPPEVVTRGQVPITLLVWGPGRVVPVRITKFTVDEKAFSTSLYPVQATVTIGVQVITAESVDKLGLKESPGIELAKTAYKYTMGQKKGLAAANLYNSAESVIGLLPLP